MKHPAIPIIRGLIVVLEQSSNAETVLQAIPEINVHLKTLYHVALSMSKKNIAGSKSPG